MIRMVEKSEPNSPQFCHNSRVSQTNGETDGRTDRRTAFWWLNRAACSGQWCLHLRNYIYVGHLGFRNGRYENGYHSLHGSAELL